MEDQGCVGCAVAMLQSREQVSEPSSTQLHQRCLQGKQLHTFVLVSLSRAARLLRPSCRRPPKPLMSPSCTTAQLSAAAGH